MTEKSRSLICRALALYLLLYAGHVLGIFGTALYQGGLEAEWQTGIWVMLMGLWSVVLFVVLLGPLMLCGSVCDFCAFQGYMIPQPPLAILCLLGGYVLGVLVIRAWLRSDSRRTLLLLGVLSVGYSMLVSSIVCDLLMNCPT